MSALPPDHERRAQDKWHVGKEIPLTLIFAIAVQTIIMVSWLTGQLADIRNNVQFVKERSDEIWRDRYTRADAERDRALMEARDTTINRTIEDHERRLRDIEAKLRNGGR